MCSPIPGRRLRGAHLRLALLPLTCAPDMSEARANDDVEFDEQMLKLRGIDPKLAGYFREAPRFTAGHHVVSLNVNGRPMGHIDAIFDERGALCVDRHLLHVAEVDLPGRDEAVASCVDLRSIYPQADIVTDPARAAVALLVPTEALRQASRDLSGYARGGAAALLNYEIVGLESRGRSGGDRYWSANTELGFNAGDWVVRSRQTATRSDGRQQADILDSYAQRSFADYRAVLQVGEIGLANPVLSGAQVAGVQVTSEQALTAQGGGAVVEGIAQSQSRVEVRQDGVLVYSTVVPAGPFSLTRIPRINRSSDLDVTVAGARGESQHFTVSPAMAGPVAPLAGYSFGAGRKRDTGGNDTSWVISGGWSGSLQRGISLSGGATIAPKYRAIGGGLAAQPAVGSQVQFILAVTQARREGVSGAQATLNLSQRLGERWAFGLSYARQGRGFRNILDTAPVQANGRLDVRSRNRDQASANVSWSSPGIGSLSAGYSRTVTFEGRGTRRALASWSARAGSASLSLSAEWNLGHGGQRGQDKSIYLNIGMPLGEDRRLSASARRYGEDTRTGVNISERVNEYASYRAGLEHQATNRSTSLSAGVSLLPRYVQIDSSYARDPDSSSYSVGVRGGLVLHAHGLTASPYAVRETFGVLALEDTAGVRVSTPAGPVWTDVRGYAVLPQLNAFGNSPVEVATDSLPRHLDIHNGAAVVKAWRGSVATLRFGVAKTRRVLFSARTPDGIDLPAGASITDEQGDLVGVVQAGGQVFVPNVLAAPRLWVDGPTLPRCELAYTLDEKPDPDALFESTGAVCRAEGATTP